MKSPLKPEKISPIDHMGEHPFAPLWPSCDLTFAVLDHKTTVGGQK